MVKILFLDFDGCLNNHEALFKYKEEPFPYSHLDPKLIGYLNQIIEQTGAKVVISSSWRFLYDFKKLEEILILRGFKGEVIGETPKLYPEDPDDDKFQRRDEIKSWLEDNEDFGGGIESFVIIEDYELMKGLEKHLIKTKSSIGLTFSHVKKAVKILNNTNLDKNIFNNKLDEIDRELKKIKGVIAVGIIHKDPVEINVYCKFKSTVKKIPSEINGVKIVATFTGPIRPA